MRRRVLLGLSLPVLVAATLTACASSRPPAPSALPPLRLRPSALGAARFALSQRLSVFRLDQPDARAQQVEVQLQLDASALLLAGFAFGQRVLLMQWDGESLRVQRSPYLPSEVDTDRMLRDLCLVFWPVEAVRAALPAGWTWVEDRSQAAQLLREGEFTRLSVRRPAEGVVEILNPTEGYRLLIESQPLETP